MQVEQPGLAGVPIAYMPNGWQAPLLIPHNGKILRGLAIILRFA